MNTFADRVRGMTVHMAKGGLCLSDREEIKKMTLDDIADEFGLDVELFVDAIDLMMRVKYAGREWEKKINREKQ